MLWKWIRVIEIVIVVEVLDTWQGIVEIGGAGNRIGEERKLEYGGNENNGQRRMIKEGNRQNNRNNLNRDGDLIVLN